MDEFMRYKNYIFDFYGTLVDIHTDEGSPLLWKRLARIYSCYGADYTGASIKRRYMDLVEQRERELGERTGYEYPEIALEDVFLELLDGAPLGHKTGYRIGDRQTWVNVIANEFRILSRKRLCAYPNTHRVLKELREAGCRLFLLSNAQRIFTQPELEITGCAPYLEQIYISSDLGMKKPQPEFLKKVIEDHSLDPKECVMVGNDFSSDMAIAQAVGIDGIFLNSFAYTQEELEERNTMGARMISDIIELLEE